MKLGEYWVCGISHIKIILMCLFLPISPVAASTSPSGFIDFNFYPYLSDVDNDNTVTINIAAQLPEDFSYFSLTNLSNQSNAGELSDTTSYYTEQNLRWKISQSSSLDLTAQLNFRTGDNNDRHRLGIRWRLNDFYAFKDFFQSIHLNYSLNLHAIQFDDQPADIWQIEHAFFMRFPYISKQLYMAGFIDHTFNEDLISDISKNPIVAEAQIGYEILQHFYLTAEYRINEYRYSDTSNLALGIEYKIIW